MRTRALPQEAVERILAAALANASLLGSKHDCFDDLHFALKLATMPRGSSHERLEILKALAAA